MTAQIDRIGNVSTASVHKATGKHWDQWIALLEKAGARGWTHGEIVAYLRKRFRPGPWWEQQVTSGFEVHIGRREVGRNVKGELSLTATKSIAASAPQVWKLFASPAGMEIWLKPLSPIKLKPQTMFETTDGFYGEIRTLLAGRRLRMTWQDPNWDRKTTVQVIVVARVQGNCILGITHDGIRDARIQARMRARWREALEKLHVALSAEAARPKARSPRARK